MKILLAGPDYEENLSIRYLSASLLSAGHDTTLAAFNSAADIVEAADAAQSADLAGLSMCFQSRAREFLSLARQIKSCDPGKLVVAGGHYASCAAGPLLANHPELDLIVIHEGEKTLVEIADALPRLKQRLPEIAGIAYRAGREVRFTNPRPMLDGLDALATPDRRGPILTIAGVPTSYLMGSRGCYGSCAYCCITTLHRLAPGKRFRQRSVENIADEMAALYHDRGTRQFVFHDDNFLVPSEAFNHARISALEGALKKRAVENIALVIKCRPADANREVLRRLKALGLVRVFLGVESATARGLSVLERNQSVDDSVRALETCRDLDISAQFTLMIFTPDATLDTLRSDAAFMRRFCGNPLNFCRAEIYAGTPLETRMIELGRARGNYLAREYSLSDPVADLACNASLGLFHSRCWSSGSLMQHAIGLDHTAAVVKRFYSGPRGEVLARRVGDWMRAVNLDTIGFMDEIIERSAAAGGCANASFRNAILALRDRECETRKRLHFEGMKLRAEVEALHLANGTLQCRQLSSSWPRLARQAAAAVLAIGIPTTVVSHPALAQQDNTASPASSASQNKTTCSLAGTVTDPSGAPVPGATITIFNEETGPALKFNTNDAGKYAANGLAAGQYSVTSDVPGFKSTRQSGVVLKAGDSVTVDIKLELMASFSGCCEYAAGPLSAPLTLRDQKKPFTYVAGTENDHGTLQGIAKLVYGDSNAWIAIFEANRNVIQKPGSVPAGTSLLIPPKKRVVPKLIFKVTPVYPPSPERLWGDVVLDVTLKADGTVEKASVIAGYPLLSEAATSAVMQWRYQPLVVKGKPVDKFVVVISFGSNGKVW